MKIMDRIAVSDPEIAKIICGELKREEEGLEMIPSENDISVAVMQAMGSVLNNKYSEGYPHKRYYGGQEFIDKMEDIAIERCKKAFNVPYANVQPYSGSPANMAVYFAVCQPGDVVMGHNLSDGGHLTHGWKVNFSGQLYKSVAYHVKPDGYIDIEEIRSLARENKPKLIWCGATAYPREFPFKELGEIADEVGAYFAADVAHIAGLIVAGVHTSPEKYAHIITTTSHKTLRGPRGGIIMVTKKGLEKDPELGTKIDKAVFPGLQGGPHDHVNAAKAVALGEALKPEFKTYCEQIVKNNKVLAQVLMSEGIKLVSNGTDNHLCLVDLTSFGPGKGQFVEEALDLAGITVNKNSIPNEPSSPFYPSGIRLGTPSLTTRGMKESEMKLIGKIIAGVIKEAAGSNFPSNKEERKLALQNFRGEISKNPKIVQWRKETLEIAKKFPLYPGLNTWA